MRSNQQLDYEFSVPIFLEAELLQLQRYISEDLG